MKILLIILAIFLLPAIIFKFIDPKKLGDKIDQATQKMKDRSK